MYKAKTQWKTTGEENPFILSDNRIQNSSLAQDALINHINNSKVK